MKDVSKLFSQLVADSQNGSNGVSKLFTTLIADSQNGSNHVLGPFCSKLESMGYDVSLDGKKIDSHDLMSGHYPEFEELPGSAHFFSLFKEGVRKQEFFVEFPGGDVD